MTESHEPLYQGTVDVNRCECCAPPPEITSSGADDQMTRRTFLLGLAAGGAGACAAPLRPPRSLKPLRVPDDAAHESVPFIDFHTHLQRRVSAEELVAHMDRAEVARMVLMPLYYGDSGGAVNDGEGSDEQARDYARRFPSRFVPFIGMQRGLLVNRDRWLNPDEAARNLLFETEWKLRSGEFFGMGEFMLRFYPYTTSLGVVAISDMDYPADSPLMLRFAELAVEYRVPMVIHCEAEPGAAAAMVRLMERYPDAKIVWAHNCGRSSVQQIRALMSRYPNLYADLGLMMSTHGEGYGSYWPRRTPWMHLIADQSGTLFPEMKALFEEFPDRFFVGTDTAHARVYPYYRYRASRWRIFFPQLSLATARKIAFENAERLFHR